jgi:hypothetical protein
MKRIDVPGPFGVTHVGEIQPIASLIPAHVRGIQTTYRGIKFRSRAEACWAAFFDQLKWTWEYESIDLEKYIPDFLISAESGKQVLFEVKGGVMGIHPLNEHTGKIQGSGWSQEAVIAGAIPCEIKRGGGYILGIAAAPLVIESETIWQWESCELFYCISCGRVSFMTAAASWACRLCGADGGHIGDAHEMVRDAWVAAKNRVQWRPSTK